MPIAKLLIVLIGTAALSSAITYGVIKNQRSSQSVQRQLLESDDAYFTNDVPVPDDQQQARTVEEMVKRCESAEVILKLADQQLMPALQPISNQEAAKKLLEAGICEGSLATFVKVKFPGKVCLPPHRLTPLQVIRVFLQWAEKNPAKLEHTFTVGYLEAFEEAFPCPRN